MKSLTLVLCVIAILGAAASAFFYVEIGNDKDELKAQVATTETRANELQAKLSDATTQRETLDKRLASLDSDLGEAKSKVTAAETRTAQLTRDVAQLNNQLTAKNEAERALSREVSELKSELARAKLASSAATPEEIDGYKATIATLQARVNELEAGARNTAGTMANTTADTTAEGSTTAASTESSAPSAPAGLTAEVVSIGAQNAFVVLNAGTAKGVQPGQTFAIKRNGNTVATAQISSVQENYAIAQIAAASLRGGLMKGDTAAAQ